MATSSFTRKIIVTGKEATDIIIDALTSDEKEKKIFIKQKIFWQKIVREGEKH